MVISRLVSVCEMGLLRRLGFVVRVDWETGFRGWHGGFGSKLGVFVGFAVPVDWGVVLVDGLRWSVVGGLSSFVGVGELGGSVWVDEFEDVVWEQRLVLPGVGPEWDDDGLYSGVELV